MIVDAGETPSSHDHPHNPAPRRFRAGFQVRTILISGPRSGVTAL